MNQAATITLTGSEPAWETGVVKFFDPIRRWGFIISDREIIGWTDVFLPWLTLRECGIREVTMKQGTRVRFRWRPPQQQGKRPECYQIKLG